MGVAPRLNDVTATSPTQPITDASQTGHGRITRRLDAGFVSHTTYQRPAPPTPATRPASVPLRERSYQRRPATLSPAASPPLSVDQPDPAVYASLLQRLHALVTDSDPLVAEQINQEIELIVHLMVHPVRSPTSAHRWAWRPA